MSSLQSFPFTRACCWALWVASVTQPPSCLLFWPHCCSHFAPLLDSLACVPWAMTSLLWLLLRDWKWFLGLYWSILLMRATGIPGSMHPGTPLWSLSPVLLILKFVSPVAPVHNCCSWAHYWLSWLLRPVSHPHLPHLSLAFDVVDCCFLLWTWPSLTSTLCCFLCCFVPSIFPLDITQHPFLTPHFICSLGELTFPSDCPW